MPSGLDLLGRGDIFQLVIVLTSWNSFLISVPDVLHGVRGLTELSPGFYWLINERSSMSLMYVHCINTSKG